MALYDRPTWQLMRALADELLTEQGSVVTKGQVHEWFRTRYPKTKRGTIDAHLSRMSTNVPVRVHYHGKPGADDLFFRIDPQRFRRYDPDLDPPPIYEGGEVSKTDVEEADTEDICASDSEFAYESDLRDYLAKNLSLVEPGLRLYEEEGITGIEYPAGGRYIDILAVDSQGGLVVVELKVSRGYDRVVGQLLRYMGWVRQNLAEERQAVRGIIVARETTEDLRLACIESGRVELFEYQLSLTVREVS